MKTYSDIGIQSPQILLPETGIELEKWAVIACDQFTSQPEYWRQVETIVGVKPSTLNLILPEVFLGKPDEEKRVQRVRQNMQSYLDENILMPQDGFVLVERRVGSQTRHGLVMALDLEHYDFNSGSQSLIRATEGTILERLPPRIKIRKDAPLELPHILVLIDDPQQKVIEPLLTQRSALKKLYDFELMLGSGHLSGFLVDQPQLENQVVKALCQLADRQYFQARYGVGTEKGVLLFAVGDGNHSLATAKSIWEKIKSQAGTHHPARYALVEVENVHDQGLIFEPIHRILFGLKKNLKAALETCFHGNIQFSSCQDFEQLKDQVKQIQRNRHAFGLITSQGFEVVNIYNPTFNLPVGTLQSFLDPLLKEGGAEKIDYVHGEDVVLKFSSQAENAGFYLPVMDKNDLFKTVILDGVLPRKTFSMGEAKEKRFYMECRRIC